MTIIKIKTSLLATALFVLPCLGHAATNYTDWSAPASYPFTTTTGGYNYSSGTTGSVVNPNNGNTVTITLDGEVLDRSAFNGFANWNSGEHPAGTYDFQTNEFDPTGEDIIAQSGYTLQQYRAHKISFSAPVSGIILAIWSLGGGNTSELLFSEDFEIIDGTDGLTRSVTAQGYKLTGTDGTFNATGGAGGLIRFYGSHSTISYNVVTPEIYSGLSIAITDQLSAGSGGPTIPIDNTAPTISIAATEVNDGDTSSDTSLSLTFTASEDTTDFTAGDINVSNGNISNFTVSSPTVYTATFTPSAYGATTIDIAAASFKDATGNLSQAASQFNWTYVADIIAPTMAITAAEVSDGDSSGDASLSMTFTANEATADFTVGDITVTNGIISNFVAVSSTVYTATFTPTATGATTIDVAAGTFTDSAGNNNTAATQFNWTYSSDPTLKADVVAGLLSKELIAYQFYKGSIQSVNDRLAWLASRRGNPNKSKQGIKFNFGDPLLNQLLNSSPKRFRDYGEAELATVASRLGSNPELYDGILKAQAISLGIAELKAKTGYTDLNPEFGSASNGWSVWSDGEVSVGKNSASTIASSREANRAFITVGLDKEYEEDNLIGFAFSAGKEDVDVGTAGSIIQSDNLGAILYTTYVSEYLPQIEASLGYGGLTFDTTRIDGSETLTGERKGGVYYGSVGVRQSNTLQDKDITYTVHTRLNLGQITLKSYSETGGSSAITYLDQDIDYEELETGIEMSKTVKWRSLTMRPHTMVQYSHFLNKSSPATMRYITSSQNYSLTVPTEMQSGWSVSAGLDMWNEGNLSSSLALSRSQSNADNYINSFSFGLRLRF
ncbi:Ig-like domain-containing protein [Alphaproteobacteria bacterium]|nr:Ig-like domain-containing protein [Alphaproteobacteria bacterium]